MNALPIVSKLPIIALIFGATALFLGGVYVMLRNPRAMETHVKWLYRPRVFFLMMATAVIISGFTIWGANFVSGQAKALTLNQAAPAAIPSSNISQSDSVLALHPTGAEEILPGIQVVAVQEFGENTPMVSLLTAVSTLPVEPTQLWMAGDFKWMLLILPDLLFVTLGTLSFVPIVLITFIVLGLLMAARSTQLAPDEAAQPRLLIKRLLHDHLANGLLATALIMALGILISLSAV